mmetsp:Transcript_36183/g.84837  ORF Transcript_36183/g.84837 Transcript_36183/m.84837 type:complete len:229 (-) Transcript_36183:1545-2231(-)
MYVCAGRNDNHLLALHVRSIVYWSLASSAAPILPSDMASSIASMRKSVRRLMDGYSNTIVEGIWRLNSFVSLLLKSKLDKLSMPLSMSGLSVSMPSSSPTISLAKSKMRLFTTDGSGPRSSICPPIAADAAPGAASPSCATATCFGLYLSSAAFAAEVPSFSPSRWKVASAVSADSLARSCWPRLPWQSAASSEDQPSMLSSVMSPKMVTASLTADKASWPFPAMLLT